MPLTVVTWNIHKGIGGLDRRYRLERVIELLKHHAPDFVLLQEVDEGVKRSRFERQIDVLGSALNFRHQLYSPTHRLRKEGHYGNAILSRWPLHLRTDMNLTVGRRKRRGAIIATSRVRYHDRSRTVALVNLHLGLAGSERDQQLALFLEQKPLTGLHHDTPVVFGGDFNDLWGTLGPKHLLPAGFHRAGAIRNTFPAFVPIRPLDAIYTSGNIRAVSCMPSRHKYARDASDHLPLIAHLELF